MGSDRTRVAIVGFGRLGRACAASVREHDDLELAGVVGRPGVAVALAPPYAKLPQAGHVRDLGRVDAALLCVPVKEAEPVALELLQQGCAVLECAQVEPSHREAYWGALAHAALRHRTRVMTGAGWDPGALTLMRAAFETLIPRGETAALRRPATSLHHTAAAETVEGVAGALAVERRDADGRLRRYLYLETRKGADRRAVAAAIEADPAFAGEQTEVLFVDSLEAVDQEAQGVLLERRGTASHGPHQTLLLEVRADPAVLAARVMADAVRGLLGLPFGGHRYGWRL